MRQFTIFAFIAIVALCYISTAFSQQNAAAMFNQADTNHDRKVSLAEIQQTYERMTHKKPTPQLMSLGMKLFNKADKDHSGFISPEEAKHAKIPNLG